MSGRNGTVVAWGDDLSDQSSVPVGLDSVIAVAAGYDFSIALRRNGTIVAWGANDDDQTTIPSGLNDITAIATGYFHAVALRRDGTIITWGDNSNRQLIVPSGLDGVTAIAAGNFNTVVLLQNGSVVVLGSHMATPPQLDSVIAIATGNSYTVVLRGKKSTTAVLKTTAGKIVFSPLSLSYKTGIIFLSSLLPEGTTFKLFDTNGRLIYKTMAPNARMRLPIPPADRVVLWRAEHPRLVVSGKLLIR